MYRCRLEKRSGLWVGVQRVHKTSLTSLNSMQFNKKENGFQKI